MNHDGDEESTATALSAARTIAWVGPFAAEHGPFWEVGLLCGVIYNWWMSPTRSLGDLMIAHGATNLALSLYVIASGRWGFWM